MKLETVIRPFETRRIAPPQRVLTAYASDPEKVTIEIGKGGSGKPMNGSSNITITVYMDTKLKEIETFGSGLYYAPTGITNFP